ncbi:MAG: TIM44-like domain-containing protein [Desulfovibrio sp.]|nr:TIM44-like domain-containing protein [Desulfovibrio sp.]
MFRRLRPPRLCLSAVPLAGLVCVPALATAVFAASGDLPPAEAPGMFGGGLISALFFGEPFTGPRLADIAVIGLVMFALFWLVAGRRASRTGPDKSGLPRPPVATPPSPRPDPESEPRGSSAGDRPSADPAGNGGASDREPSLARVYQAAEAAWGGLRSTPASGRPAPDGSRPAFQNQDEEFLAGAKAAYARIREAMEKGDTAGVAPLVAPEFLEELGRLARRRFGEPGGPASQVLLIEAGIADRRSQGNIALVDTLFEVLAKKSGQSEDDRTREIWTFARDASLPGSMWRLSGIRPGPEGA